MAALSMPQRQALPASKFALPGQGAGKGGKGSGSYPVNDRAHAIAAKAMASRFASPGQRKVIDAKANVALGKKKARKAAPKPLVRRDTDRDGY